MISRFKCQPTSLQNYDPWTSQIPDIPNLSQQHTEMYVNDVLNLSRETCYKNENKNKNKLTGEKENKDGNILPISNPYSVNVFYESHGAVFTTKQDRERLKFRYESDMHFISVISVILSDNKNLKNTCY